MQQNKKFKRLQATWYKKLEKSGFKDIENTAHELRPLKRWSNDFRKKSVQCRYEAHLDYFCKAEHFLNDYLFETKQDKQIWELHVQGLSYRDISKALKITKDKVRKIVLELKAAMYGQS